MQYKLFQVLPGLTRDYGFMGLSERNSVYGDAPINMSVYGRTYAGTTLESKPYAALDRLWEIFNINHPVDYTGRSMSVGDIVELSDGANVSYWYCDSFGWKAVLVEGVCLNA